MEATHLRHLCSLNKYSVRTCWNLFLLYTLATEEESCRSPCWLVYSLVTTERSEHTTLTHWAAPNVPLDHRRSRRDCCALKPF